jgi:hypothetical protein
MTTTTPEPTLVQVLDLAARLAPADQLRVIERLARAIVPAVQAAPRASRTLALPVITEGTWNDAIPMRRKDLYDDCERRTT